MSEIIQKIKEFKDLWNEKRFRYFICNCEWCKICKDRLDNERLNEFLNLSIKLEQYEISSLIKKEIDCRIKNNIVYTEEYKKQLLEKQKQIYKKIINKN